MSLTIPGFPENCVAVAYRKATELEHWFEPSGEEGLDGSIFPGPSKDVVLVVAPASGHLFGYNIDLDRTLILKNDVVEAEPQADISADTVEPLRAHSLMSFERISAQLLNGKALRARRATWAAGRYITSNASHHPHFTEQSGKVWAYRADDLRARDWQVLE